MANTVSAPNEEQNLPIYVKRTCRIRGLLYYEDQRERPNMSDSIKQILEACPFFAGMKSEHLRIIAEGATQATFGPEEFVFQEGEPANRLYLVKSGRIAVEAHEPANGTIRVQVLGPGDILGWSWMFPPFVWHLRARAVEPVKVIVLNAAHLLICAEREHDFGYELMKRVAQVVIHRLQITRK